MSEHLHSHAEPHSCSLSEHSLQFELRSTAPSFPFLFPSTPNHHVPAPTLNLSSNPPLSVAASLKFTPSSLLPPSASCARPSYPALPTTTLLYPTQHIFGKDLSERCLWILWLFLCFKTLFLFLFFLKNMKREFTPISWHLSLFSVTLDRLLERQLLRPLKFSSEKC